MNASASNDQGYCVVPCRCHDVREMRAAPEFVEIDWFESDQHGPLG